MRRQRMTIGSQRGMSVQFGGYAAQPFGDFSSRCWCMWWEAINHCPGLAGHRGTGVVDLRDDRVDRPAGSKNPVVSVVGELSLQQSVFLPGCAENSELAQVAYVGDHASWSHFNLCQQGWDQGLQIGQAIRACA